MAAAVPSVLLYNSFADPKQGFAGYCATAKPDWKGTRTGSWPGRHREVCTPFRDGALRSEQAGDDRGRGLFCGADVKRGAPICAQQPPLALHQYEDSRRVCEACAHCGRFIGSLRSALLRPLEALKAAKGGRHGLELPTAEELVEELAALDELEAGEWLLSERIPCEHDCGAVFCGTDCAAAAKIEGWHRVFCTDLAPERRHVWRRLRAHGARHHEPLVLAAQVIGEIVCLVKHHGADLFEAMSYFTRFAKMSWLSMLNLPSRSTTQVLPKKGHLADIADAKRHKRYEVLTNGLDMLMALLWERQFAELLTLDFYSNLVGQFSLSNVWVQLEHPLSDRLRSRLDDAEFRQKFGKLIEASSRAASALAPEEEEEEPAKSKGDAKVEAGLEDAEVAVEKAKGKETSEADSWWLPRYEGTGLYVCCALSNHSCQPSFTLGFSDGGVTSMIALRDLKAGEELTLAYVSPFGDLDERLTHLWRTWGFVCTCRRCQDQLMKRIMERGSVANATGGTDTIEGPCLAASSSSAAVAGLTSAGVAAAAAVVAAHLREDSPCPSPSAAKAPTVALLPEKSGESSPAPPPTTAFQPPARADASAAGRVSKDNAAESSSEDEEDEDNDDEEEEEEQGAASSSDDDDDFEGRALAGLNPYVSPLGPRAPPPSVLALEADLKRMMELMGDDED